MIDLTFDLAEGGRIFLDEFHESRTYTGLLEGKPNAKINLGTLKSATWAAGRIWPEQPCVILGLDYYERNPDKTLPSIECSGLFISYGPARNMEMMASCLAVVWFQEEMFPLLQGDNAKWLTEVAWKNLAMDFDW